MDANQKIKELLLLYLQRQDILEVQFELLKGEFMGYRMHMYFARLKDHLGLLEYQQITINRHLIELKNSVQRLNKQMENFGNHEDRISRLESFMRAAS